MGRTPTILPSARSRPQVTMTSPPLDGAISVDRLKSRMRELGLNQLSTAKRAGLGADYVRDLVRGKVRQPSALKLTKLAEALECSPSYLMGLDKPEPRKPLRSREQLEQVGNSVKLFDAAVTSSTLDRMSATLVLLLSDGLSSAIQPHLPEADDEDMDILLSEEGLSLTGRASLAHALGLIEAGTRRFCLMLDDADRSLYDDPSTKSLSDPQVRERFVALAGLGPDAADDMIRVHLGLKVASHLLAIQAGAADARIELHALAEDLLAEDSELRDPG